MVAGRLGQGGRSVRGVAAAALLAAVLAAGPARAVLSCTARVDRTSVPAGGEVVLTVTAEGDVGWSLEFDLPDLGNVRVHAGGTNQSMSMVNGRTRSTVTRTWYLRVSDEGPLEIGPVTVSGSGETCRTEPLRVTVTPPASGGPPPADTGNRTPPPAEPRTQAPERAGGDIFVTLAVDKPEAWLGEQIVLTFRYWRRVQPWNNPSYTPPRTEGFWREDLGPERNLREVRDGRVYTVTEIRYALFPTRAGELVIEPAELTFPEDVFDRFFNSRRRSRGPRVLRTDRLTVSVRPLPEPAPDGFTGLVANDLQLTAAVSPDTVPAGEPVELEIGLQADGFLKGFAGLQVVAPANARLHDAAEAFDTRLRDDRLAGTLSVEKVLVPEREGILEVPPTTLTWFDADRGRYVTSSTPVHRVTVTPGTVPTPAEGSSGFLRSEIARLGEDLAFIHAPPRSLRRVAAPFAGSAAWWALLVLPAVLLAGWCIVLGRLAAERRDPAGRRRRRALREARRVLAAAEGDPAQVARAIRGYVADATNRPPAAVDAGAVTDLCARRGLPEAGARLTDLLARCDAARFGGAAADADALAAAAAGELARLEQAGRARPAGGPGAAAVLLAAALLAAGTAPVGADEVAADGGADPVRLLAEGNQAYTEGDLDRALALYEQVAALGIDDPVLHYNLANTRARRGELGYAVAGYLRALRLDPRDGDARANLAWVRGQLRDLELTADRPPLLIAWFVAAVERLTLDEWAAVVLVLAWGLAAVAAWGLWREEFSDNLRRAALGLAGLLVAAAAITGWRWSAEVATETAVVVADESAVRSGPAGTFPTLFMVHDGLQVRLDGERPGWVRVSLGGDWEGWLPRADVVRVRPREPQGR